MLLGLLTCAIASPPPASDLVVRHDADGAPRALLWSGAPGPALRSAEDPALIHEDVEGILELSRTRLGVPARSPLATLELVELVPSAPGGPDGRGPVRSYARFRQRHRGVAIKDGDLRFLWRDGRLLRVNGRPRAVSELTGLDARLDAGVTDGAELPTTLAARCPTRIELDDAPAEYDVGYQDLVRDVFCGQERWRVGLSDQTIHTRGPRAHGWGPHAGGVTMTAVRNGSTDATTPWFPGNTLPSFVATEPTPLTQHHGVLIDSEPRPGSPGNCNYRATYDGNPAAFPFPNVRVNGSLYYASGSCTGGGSAFGATALSNALGFQVAYRAINTAARHAAWQQDLALFALVPWSSSHALSVDIAYDTTTDSCPFGGVTGNEGAYDETTRRICIDADTALPVRTAVHEYAHYVSARYGLDLSGTSCAARATTEGIADALTVSFEHFRYNPLNTLSTATARDGLAVRGPGFGMRRLNLPSPGNARPRLDRLDEYVPAVTSCVGSSNTPYYQGVAIGQVFWALLMNRICSTWQTNTCVGVVRIGQGGPPETLDDTTYAFAARESFTWTIKLADTLSPFAFLQDYLDDLLTVWSSIYTPDEAGRVVTAFQAHGGFVAP